MRQTGRSRLTVLHGVRTKAIVWTDPQEDHARWMVIPHGEEDGSPMLFVRSWSELSQAVKEFEARYTKADLVHE